LCRGFFALLPPGINETFEAHPPEFPPSGGFYFGLRNVRLIGRRWRHQVNYKANCRIKSFIISEFLGSEVFKAYRGISHNWTDCYALTGVMEKPEGTLYRYELLIEA
jgi:hypothetical protein